MSNEEEETGRSLEFSKPNKATIIIIDENPYLAETTPKEKRKTKMRQKEQQSCGEIHLWMGPMYSEKTTELQRLMRRYFRALKPTIVLKYAKDDLRYGKDCVTHDGHSMQATSVSTLMPHLKFVASNYYAVGIDEGQFFPDLVPFCNALVKLGKVVVVAALDGTFERKPFPPVVELIPYCKRVHKLLAICACCGNDAAFTRRLSSRKETEIIGGSELYHANCGDCFDIPLAEYIQVMKPRRPMDNFLTALEDTQQ